MNLTFDDADTLQSLTTLSFAADSPVKYILDALQSAPHSLSVVDLVGETRVDEVTIKAVLIKLYKAGIVYTEQRDHYSLTQYGQQMIEHVGNDPKVGDFSINTQALRGTLNFVAENTPLTGENLQKVTTNSLAAKALQVLVQRGYVVQVNPDQYDITEMGQTYVTEFNKGRHTIQKGMPDVDVQRNISDDFIMSIYQRLKVKHPEYANIYERYEHTPNFKVEFSKDVRRFLAHGSPIEYPIWSKEGAPLLQESFKSKTMPYISSIEDAVMYELYYFQIRVTSASEGKKSRSQASTFGHVFTMQEIKAARQYIAALKQLPEQKVNAIVSKLPAGTIITEEDLMKIAADLLKADYPHVQYTGPNQNAIEKIEKENLLPQVSQAISSKVDPSHPIIFPNDSPSRLAGIVGQVLKENNVEQFNKIESAAEVPDPTLDAALGILFQQDKNFGNQLWADIVFDSKAVTDVDFNHTDFSGGNVSDTHFTNCNLLNSKFTRTNIHGTHFEHCDITDADFAGAIEVEKAVFMDCTGRAKNLPKIYRTEVNQDEIGPNGRITNIVKTQPEKNLQTFYDSKLNRFELALAPKLLAIMKGRQASFLWGKPKALRFQVFAALTDEQKNDLTEFIKGGQPPAWLTKDALVQLNRSGEIKPIQDQVTQLGVVPRTVGKMVELVAGPRAPKAPKPALVKSQEEQDNEKINAVVSQFKQYYGSGVVNPKELAPVFESPEFADIGNIFKGAKTEQDVIDQLQKYLQTNDASPQVTDFRNKEKLFSYTSRLTDIGPQDRTYMQGYYQDKMFAVLLSPNDNGVTNPDVRKILHSIRTGNEKEITPHWRDALASARIEPHVFTTSDGGEIKSKRVWIIVELQADPLQKNSDGFLNKIEPEISGDFTNYIGYYSLEEEVVKALVAKGSLSISSLRPVAEKLLRQNLAALESYRVVSKRGRQGEEVYFHRTKKVSEGKMSAVGNAIQSEIANKHSATFEELLPVAQDALLKSLTTKGVCKKQNNDLVPTPLAPKMLRAYGAIEGLRSTFRRWPEAIILDTINRALQIGNVDEIWVASAEDFSQAKQEAGSPWNLNDVYDRGAEKFTNKAEMFYPRVTVQGEASTIYSGAPHTGPGGAYMGYHVIDLKKWKPGAVTASLHTLSSLRFVTSVYEGFVAKYLENLEQMYPYLNVLPLEAKIESAGAMFVDNGKMPPNMVARFLGEVNQTYNLHITEPFAPYVRIIAGFAKVMDQRITRVISRTGESPKRTLQDFATGLAEHFIPEGKRSNFEQMLNDVVDAHMEVLLPEANRVYNEQQQLGMNTNTEPPAGGEEPVGPGGESFPAEETALPEGEQGEQLPPVKFEKPTHHEYENLKEEQIDQLLEKFKAETDPVKKEKLRRQLHELSTLADLRFASLTAEAIIKHEHGKWLVKTHDGKRILGEHASEESAKKQLQAIEISKHKHGSMEELVFANYDFGGSPRNDPNQVSNKNMPTKVPLKKMVKTLDEKPGEDQLDQELKFSAVDEEFTRRKDEPFETGRNDWWQYEPAHGEGSPVIGGPGGQGGAEDTANMDMKGGFYTDLNLPDMDKEKKQQVTFDPGRVNLQLWTSLKLSEDASSQNPYVIEKGSGRKGAILGPGSTSDTVLVLWDGTETPVEARKFHLTNDVSRSGFDTPPGSALKPKERPRQQDVNYRQGSLSFAFVEFKNRVMPFVRKLSKYANMDDSKLTDVLYEEYKLAQKKNLL